jgi:CHASE3 domain sensor protein
MALYRNIAGIGAGQSDAQALLDAYNASNGKVVSAEASTPVMQVKQAANGAVAAETANIATVTQDSAGDTVVTPSTTPAASADAAPGVKTAPLLLMGIGAGALYLLSRKRGGAMAGKKKKGLLIPALIVGGVAAWWYFSNRKSTQTTPATTSTTDGTAAVDPTAQMRAELAGAYAGQQKQLAAIASADAETLRRWYLIISQYWNTGTSPYTVNVNGQPTTDYNASLGKWWENFATSKGLI